MANQFLILVIDTATGTADAGEMVAIDAFNDKLVANGQWITAGGLSSPDHGLLIDNRAGTNIVEKRALFSGPENYSGFWLIKTESVEVAQTLALEGSKACNRKVELRPLLG